MTRARALRATLPKGDFRAKDIDAFKIGCVPQTLLEWVKRQEVDPGMRNGVTTAAVQRAKELEREVKDLRRANAILPLASAFFAQAKLDGRLPSW